MQLPPSGEYLPPLILVDALERLVLPLFRGLLLLAGPRHLGQFGVDLRLVGLASGFLNVNVGFAECLLVTLYCSSFPTNYMPLYINIKVRSAVKVKIRNI